MFFETQSLLFQVYQVAAVVMETTLLIP